MAVLSRKNIDQSSYTRNAKSSLLEAEETGEGTAFIKSLEKNPVLTRRGLLCIDLAVCAEPLKTLKKASSELITSNSTYQISSELPGS